MLRHGEVVRWRYEMAQTDAEREAVYLCLEPAEDGRCLIRPLVTGLEIVPVQLVKQAWLERCTDV